ncbi:MAG: thymidylate kinase [Anaerolineales bacterium]|nr:MAG: thymidylate kinase [Anaerolineales bacterium]
MTEMNFYGYGLPGVKHKNLPGKLIVVEGTDGVGRSTQVALLKEWLESEGYAVSATGLKRGKLAGKGIQQAMEGHTVGDTTMNLFYATDMVDRLGRDILPALRAGFVVLTDRYIYSIIARALVRGADPVWIRNVFGFALVPDIVFYLQADLTHLVPRVLNARGFDYWESGVDFLQGRDYYDSFVEYQTRLLAQFDAIADEFNFARIDANCSIREIFQSLQAEIKELLKGMKPPKGPKETKKKAERKAKEKEDKKKGEEKPKEKGKEKEKEKEREAKRGKERARTKETKK